MIADGQIWEIYPFNTAAPELRRVHDISLAGDGEPTTCKQLPEVVELVGRLREEHGLQEIKLHILTNATMFHRPAVEAALDRWAELGGEVWAKLDAGTAPYFRLVDGTSIPFHRVLANIKSATKRWPTRLQCMFHTWEGAGPDNAEIQAWSDHIEGWLEAGGKILEVQVYSVARRPGDDRVGILPEKRLERIARAARDLEVPVTIYPGVEWKS
jgi:hypothetical protein